MYLKVEVLIPYLEQIYLILNLKLLTESKNI